MRVAEVKRLLYVRKGLPVVGLLQAFLKAFLFSEKFPKWILFSEVSQADFSLLGLLRFSRALLKFSRVFAPTNVVEDFNIIKQEHKSGFYLFL